MGDNKTIKNKEAKSKVIRRIIDITLAAALVVAVVYTIKAVTNDFSDINRIKEESESTISTSQAELPSNDGAMIYVTDMADNSEIHSGSLIVVNSELEYKGKEGTLVSMYDLLQDDGTTVYTVMSSDVRLKIDAATALNKMVKAFASETGKNDIIVDGGYRSVEYQQELYDAAEDKSTAAKPGFSDYHTGYSIDFMIDNSDGGDFTGEGDYGWFEKNCYKYGYILRFPDGKKDFTGYDYRPWHFRYVGKAPAYYMNKNNLCLEEYVEKLKNYEYTKTHLTFTDDNGNEYETYYYPMDKSVSTTVLAIPNTEYQMSGNNTDGFIVTFMSKSAEEKTTDNTKTTENTDITQDTNTTSSKSDESSKKTEE